AATQLIVQDGSVVGVRSGDKGRGRDGEPLGNFEPGTDIKAQATVLAEGCWGHLTGGSWMYPMKDEKTGDDLVSIGFVIDLDYADATTSAHDLLQQFKTHPLVKGILEGGERVGWGAKALPGGGWWSMPRLVMPGAVLAGD